MDEKKKLILLIDDEPEVVWALRDVLEMFGFRVHTALTGKQGFREAVRHKPDLLLLDISLPDIHGYHLLRRIREREKRSGDDRPLPIVIMTGHGLPTRVLCETEGIDGYIQKPFGREELLEVLQDALAADDDSDC